MRLRLPLHSPWVSQQGEYVLKVVSSLRCRYPLCVRYSSIGILVCSLALVASTAQAAVEPDQPEQAAETRQQPITWYSAHKYIKPCETAPSAEQSWSDRTYLQLSQTFCDQAAWFDNFFSSTSGSNEHASSLVRIRMQYEWYEKEGTELKPRISARFYLPRTEKRFKLIIEGGEEPDNQILRKEPEELKTTDHHNGGLSAAIRWLALNEKYWDVSFDGGVHVRHAQLDPFVRQEIEYERPITQTAIAKASQTFLVNARDFWTETSEFHIDHVHDTIGYRWYNRLEYGDETNKWEWQTSFIRAKQLDDRTAAISYLSFKGATGDKKGDESENITLGVNFRRSFYRPWMFYEVEPMLNWPRKYDHQLEPAIQFNIEIAFGKSRRKSDYKPLQGW